MLISPFLGHCKIMEGFCSTHEVLGLHYIHSRERERVIASVNFHSSHFWARESGKGYIPMHSLVSVWDWLTCRPGGWAYVCKKNDGTATTALSNCIFLWLVLWKIKASSLTWLVRLFFADYMYIICMMMTRPITCIWLHTYHLGILLVGKPEMSHEKRYMCIFN